MSQVDDVRGEYLDSISFLFDAAIHHPPFEQNQACKETAMEAQLALGAVEILTMLDQSNYSQEDKKGVAGKLREAEAALASAVEKFLAKAGSSDNRDIVQAAGRVASKQEAFRRSVTNLTHYRLSSQVLNSLYAG
jgi:hypothetical protein